MPATQATQKDPVIVVLQLTGGNDYLNTVIPYNNPLYRDNRKAVGIPDNQIMHLDKDYGIPHYMAPLKQFWDDGKLAILHGVGFKDSPRSHFRAMDIWHTCEPIKVGTEGWLGRVAREFDPEQGKRRHHGQLRPEPAALAGGAGRAGRLRCRSAGALRLPADHSGRAAQAGSRSLRAHVQARGRRRPRHGLHEQHRVRFLEGRGHPEGRAAEVHVDGAVSEHADRAEAPGHRPSRISPISAAGSSTATTAPSTRMPARTPATAICGPR